MPGFTPPWRTIKMSLLDRFVLVVDDDSDICWALHHLLGKVGARCIWALDGQSALEAVRLHNPDLVLLDAKLPDMNGLDLGEKIRCVAPGIRILVVSGYFYKDDPVIQAALAQGLICGFVEKPFSHASLIGAMEAVLGQACQRA
jgi:DNA-binding NtrC family response regulator